MKSLFSRAAVAVAALCFVTIAHAAGSYPTPIFQGVKIAGCSNGYLKPQGLTPASCISAIPGADLAAGAAVANLGFTPLGPSDMGTSGHKVPYLDGTNSWTGAQTIAAPLTFGGNNVNIGGKTRAQLVTQFPYLDGLGYSAFGWNYTSGGGELDLLINRDGGNAGGLNVYDFPTTSGDPALMARIHPNGLRVGTSGYYNLGATDGASGYGVRDNGGVVEIKNSGSGWNAALTAGHIGTSGHAIPYLDTANTWSGDQIISKANPGLILDKASGISLIRGRKSGSDRWAVQFGNGGAEVGANAGSDFVITRYDDAGAWLSDPFAITRSNGVVYIANGLQQAANTYHSFGNTSGSSGYGIRDNSGSVEAKDSGGAWRHVATESLTVAGDANYTILATDDHVYHSALTAARTDTLPAANSVKAGHAIRVQDVLGVATATNTISVQRSGADTINGVTSVVAVNSAYGGTTFVSDGVSKWSYVPPQTGTLACANLPPGAWCLLNTLTASSSASLADTISFTPTYAHYEIYLDNIMPATATASCIFRVYSGGAFQNSSYVTLMYHGNTGGAANIAPTNGIPCNAQVGTMASPGLSLHLHVYKPTATGSKVFNGSEGSSIQAGGAIETFYALNGYWAGGTGAITGFDVYFSSGNIASGEIRVYGHN